MILKPKLKRFKYIYGPVSSWRLGRSLGIDPISSNKKACTFNCIYCQVGRTTKFSKKRKIYVKTEKIIDEIKSLPHLKIDYITFSGRGEPTLAKNLGVLIKTIKKLRKEKIAVLTNSSLISRQDVRNELALADFVVAKIDAPSERLFNLLDKPMRDIKFGSIIEGIKKFRRIYTGRLGLQIMFIELNKKITNEWTTIIKEIKPDEVQINTPTRPSQARPLLKKEIVNIKNQFLKMSGFKGDLVLVYDSCLKAVSPISTKRALERRGRA